MPEQLLGLVGDPGAKDLADQPRAALDGGRLLVGDLDLDGDLDSHSRHVLQASSSPRMLSGMGRDCGGWDPSVSQGWDQCDPRTIPPSARRWPSARRAMRERPGRGCACQHDAPHLHDADPSGQVRARAASVGPVTGPAVLHWTMLPLVVGQSQEHAWLVTLDVHTRLDGVWLLALGTRDRVGVDLIEAIRPAIVRDSRYVVLAHNHPSGDATPSDADAELTDAVGRAAAVQGVVLVDHVVLAPEQFYSFREGALWQIQTR